MPIDLLKKSNPMTSVLLYSSMGTLKTTTLAQLPKVLIVQDAQRQGAGDLGKVDVTNMNWLRDWPALAAEIAQSKYESVGLDDVHLWISRQITALARDGKMDQLSQYRNATSWMRQGYDTLRASGKHVWVTCGHAVDDELVKIGDRAILRKVVHPDLPPALREYIGHMSRVVAYGFYSEQAGGRQHTALCWQFCNDKQRVAAKVTVGLAVPERVPMQQLVATVLKAAKGA